MSKKKDINFPQAAIHSKELNKLSTTARWLYAVIAREAEDKEATFRFKYDQMIEITGFAKSTISRGLIDLEVAGFIRFGQIKSCHTNEYTIIDWRINNTKTSTKFPDTSGYIYMVLSENLYKIGCSKYPTKRIDKYHTQNPHPVKLVLLAKVEEYRLVERTVLSMFKSKKHQGEWFGLDQQDVVTISDYILSRGGLLVGLP